MAKKNEGKVFETSVEASCNSDGVFYFRVRDVNPMAIKPKFKLPQNKYDALLYHNGYLFPVELKSTKGKSISFSESMIKAHQIKSLTEAIKFKGIISGFLFNFRLDSDNKTYFVPIGEFNKYKMIAENQIKDHTYKSKVNKSSIPIAICEEIGIELHSELKKVNYRYEIRRLLDELINENKE